MVAVTVREDSYRPTEDIFTVSVNSVLLGETYVCHSNTMGIKFEPLYLTLHVRLILWLSSTHRFVVALEVITGGDAATNFITSDSEKTVNFKRYLNIRNRLHSLQSAHKRAKMTQTVLPNYFHRRSEFRGQRFTVVVPPISIFNIILFVDKSFAFSFCARFIVTLLNNAEL